MRRTSSRFRRTSAADDGFTLIELLVTMSLLLIVMVVLFSGLVSISNSQAYQADRNDTLDVMRVTLNRMTKELRQASSVSTSSTDSYLEFDTFDHGTTAHIVYSVSGSDLTRTLNSGNAVTVISGLATPSIFTYVEAPPVPGAQWVRINLQVRPPRSPDTILVLDSEINLRNRTTSS